MYGTLANFNHLVSEAKKRDNSRDFVISHTSDQHPLVYQFEIFAGLRAPRLVYLALNLPNGQYDVHAIVPDRKSYRSGGFALQLA
jgi:hypothetical protein